MRSLRSLGPPKSGGPLPKSLDSLMGQVEVHLEEWGDFRQEIDSGWWKEAGMESFQPKAESYCPYEGCESESLSLKTIEPPKRNAGIDSFKKERMVNILSAIRNGTPLPPVVVWKTVDGSEWEYELRQGYHRYYASVAAGFKTLPAVVQKRWV